jgi:LysR family nod box-dependent transcriptional activator
MRFQGLDLNLLVALNALILDRNVTRAADRLHIGQPGMSAALTKLRLYFKDDLLVSMGRRMVLTPLAEQLMLPLQEILAEIERSILSRGQFDPATAQQKFVFALSDHATSVLLPSLLLEIEHQAPGLRFEVAPITDRNDLDIERCEIDFLVVPSEFTSPHHPRALLHTESWVCICWAGNTLIGERITEEDYLSLGHVLIQFGRGQGYSHDERFLREKGIVRRADVVVPSLNVIPELIVGSHRIATVPSRLARRAARQLPLRIIDPPIDIPPHQTMLQWNKMKDLDLAMKWIKDRLIDVCANNFGAPPEVREARAREIWS